MEIRRLYKHLREGDVLLTGPKRGLAVASVNPVWPDGEWVKVFYTNGSWSLNKWNWHVTVESE